MENSFVAANGSAASRQIQIPAGAGYSPVTLCFPDV